MSETLVIGGGLAGGGAAAVLARAGTRVLLLEREAEPRDKICGEFLSGEGVAHLAAMGLDVASLGGVAIDRLRLATGARCVEARLPFKGFSLTRRRLDAALLDHAERLGAKVERGADVTRLGADAVETSLGPLRPRTILLASGKHEVRGAKRATAGTRQGYIGFKQYFRVGPAVRAALDGFVEIVFFPGGYAGLQLVEGGVANLCLLVGRDRFAALGRRWSALFEALLEEPHLARRLSEAEPLSDRPLTISDVPYGFLYRAKPDDSPSVYRLGDQAAVIPSFSGGGMSIALHSARLAAAAVGEGADAAVYHRRLRGDVAGQVGIAMRMQRFSDAEPARAAMVAALGLVPGALAGLARWTRVPTPALRRAGVGV